MSEFYKTGELNSSEVLIDQTSESQERAHLYEVLTVFRLSMVFAVIKLSMVLKDYSGIVGLIAIALMIGAIWAIREFLGQDSKVYIYGKFITLGILFWPALFCGAILNGFLRVASLARAQFSNEIDHHNEKHRFYRNVNDRMEGR